MESSLNGTTLGTLLVKPLVGVRPMADSVIVYPLYDADRVGLGERIIIPDSAKNPESQQGYVVAIGRNLESLIALLDHVVYEPYSANDAYGAIRVNGQTYLRVWYHNLVGKVRDRELEPLPGWVVVQPEWDNLGPRQRAGGVIAIDPTVWNVAVPPRFGRVLEVGAYVSTVKAGDRVILPPEGGHEIGWIDHVIYTIPEQDLLATLP